MYAALGSVNLGSPTAVNLQPSVAVGARFFVGATLPSNLRIPASGARVTVAAGSGGPTVTSLAGTDGTAVVYVPAALPLPATSFCVAAESVGFASASECGISPNGLGTMTGFSLALTPVPVSIEVTGVPSGIALTLNVTAHSPSAINVTLTGGPTWSVSLPPGAYQISGWAPGGSGSVLYLPTGVQTEVLPVGATSETFALSFVSQTSSSGTIALPSGGALTGVTVSLLSASFIATVPGTNYTKGFFAPVGSYSAYATVKAGSTTYSALLPVTVAANGVISPTIPLNTLGEKLSGTLEDSSGGLVSVTAPLTLTVSTGASALVKVTNGTFTAVLPADQNYTVNVAVTTIVQGLEGSYSKSWVQTPGASCVLAAAATPCTVTMVGTDQLVWLNGTLTAPGVPGLVPGTVRLYGPSTDPVLSVVTAADGTFSAQVLPGQYSLYASGGGGSEPLAGFASVAAYLNSPSLVSVVLAPTWADTVVVVPPAGSAPLLGPVNVTVTNAVGVAIPFASAPPSNPLVIALPVGSYTASASSFGAPGGLLANASATTAVKVVNGNVGTTLTLAFQYTYRVVATGVGATQATVTSPGTASFAFSVRNTGDTPIVVHPVGSPAFWGFNFSFSNATLLAGASGNTLAASVLIQVPGGTATVHPHVVISLELANGTVVGAFSPTVNVVPYFGIVIGTTSTSQPIVGVNRALVPFYVVNTGNVEEMVSLSVVDAARLATLGWVATVQNSSGPLIPPTVTIPAFTNVTYAVNLTATGSIFVPVGEFTVQASVQEQVGSYQASTIVSVPTVSVRTAPANGTAPATVTGPSVGPAPNNLPDWVVPLLSFIPAIALVLGVITYRWWRSRRWTRR